MQPQNGENDFEQQQAVQKNHSVFDFLYHDPRRIASFLSQFDTYGQLLSIKAVESEKQSASSVGMKKIAGTLALAKGEASNQEANTEESIDGAERTYDPLWTNARTLLSYLEDRDLIVRDINEARIGQFVLVTGTLAILDIAMFKNMYSGSLSEMLRAGIEEGASSSSEPALSRNERRRNRSRTRQGRSSSEPTAEDILAMVEMMPHSVQLRLFTDDFNVWSMPEPEYMISSPASLMLKNGIVLRGLWSMIGVLDAFPDGTDGEIVPLSEEFARLLGGTPIGGLAAQLAPIARQSLGRPGSAFGMTPLLIFRSVAG